MSARPETEGAASARTSTTTKDPLIGRAIDGRFHVTRLIARGGMGKVYLAEQAPLGRRCAVKVLDPNSDADPEFCRRFYREASTAARLTHPNTVTVFDYGRTSDDIYYIAMEYLEGKTLHRTIRDEMGLEEPRVISIASQICRSLREAHSIGIIHRDLKPANVLLVRHGDEQDFVKVLDFGLVKQLGESPDDQLTQTGLFMGSPKYMAPEQIHGHAVDARTDVYALGVMMFEMLTGRVPFERPTNVGVLMAHVSERPPRLADVKPGIVVSRALEDVVMRCLEKQPDDRVASMSDLLAELRKSVGLPTGETPHTAAVFVEASLPARATAPSGASIMPVPINSIEIEHLFSAHRRPRTWRQRIAPIAFAVAAMGLFCGVAARSGVSLDALEDAKLVPSVPRTLKQRGAKLAESAPNQAIPVTATRRLRVTTDPAGARVTEDGNVLCEKAPCELTFSDDTEHVLTISRPGFRTETKSVRAQSGTIELTLAKIAVAAPPPPRELPRPKPAPAEVSRREPVNPISVPSGYKDIP